MVLGANRIQINVRVGGASSRVTIQAVDRQGVLTLNHIQILAGLVKEQIPVIPDVGGHTRKSYELQ